MVVIINEKQEPPPYAAVDPTHPSTEGGTPTLPARPSQEGGAGRGTGNNYIRVVRDQDDIRGNWTIDPTLPPPSHLANGTSTGSTSSSIPPRPGAASGLGPNIRLETQRGIIDIGFTWISGDKETPLPRAFAEVVNQSGPISIETTARPKCLPLHISATSVKKGDVRIRLPSDFRGVLALRGTTEASTASPSVPTAPTQDFILSPTVNERVTYTREIAQTIKSKGKGKPTAGSTNDSDGLGGTTYEYLIGSDLELGDFNRASVEKGPGSLDFIQAKVKRGRVLIYTKEDAEEWEVTALAGKEASTMEGAQKPPVITIQVEEPRWLESAKRKLNKLAHQTDSGVRAGTEQKVGEMVNGVAGWLYTSCQVSVNTLKSLQPPKSPAHKRRAASSSSIGRPQPPSPSPSFNPPLPGSPFAPPSYRTDISSIASSSSIQLVPSDGTQYAQINPPLGGWSQHLVPPPPPPPPRFSSLANRGTRSASIPPSPNNSSPNNHNPVTGRPMVHQNSDPLPSPTSPPRSSPIFQQRHSESSTPPYYQSPRTPSDNLQSSTLGVWVPTNHPSRSAESLATPPADSFTPQAWAAREPPPQHPTKSYNNMKNLSLHSPTQRSPAPEPPAQASSDRQFNDWLRRGNEAHERLVPMFTGGGGVRDWSFPQAQSPQQSNRGNTGRQEKRLPSAPAQIPSPPPHSPPSSFRRVDSNLSPPSSPAQSPNRAGVPPPLPIPVPGSRPPVTSPWTSSSSVASRPHTVPSPGSSRKLLKPHKSPSSPPAGGKLRSKSRSKSTPDLREEAKRAGQGSKGGKKLSKKA